MTGAPHTFFPSPADPALTDHGEFLLPFLGYRHPGPGLALLPLLRRPAGSCRAGPSGRTSECSQRVIPALVAVVGVFLVIAGVAAFIQALPLSPVPLHAVADAGSIVRSAVPDLPGASKNDAVPALPPPDLNTTGNTSVPGPLANTTLTTPEPSRTPKYAGPVVTITGTSPYSYQAPVMGSSPEVPVINTTSRAARVHALVNEVRQENGRSVLGHRCKAGSHCPGSQ
jgi:hypothetical protein